MTILTGKEFNEKYVGQKFVKLTNKEEKHNGYEFKSGLNVDTKPFNPRGKCEPGGIYFCELGKLPIWLEYGYQKMYYARLVSIPEDAQVYEEYDKFKADRLVLGERRRIEELEVWSDERYCVEAVKQNGYALEYVGNQTKEICLAAVKQNGYALRYVLNQSEEICLEAVKRNVEALQYVKNETEAVCLAAINWSGMALQYVRDQRETICLEAVRENGWALEYVRDQTEAICMAAVRQNGLALQYVRDQTKEICMAAVKQNSNALQYVKIKVYSRK